MVAFILHIIIHEGGHLVAGLLTGYRFVSFRIFSLTLIRKDGRYQWRNFSLGGTGGQCLMAPPLRPLEEIDTRWYNLGGVLANIVVSTLALVLMLCFDLPDWAESAASVRCSKPMPTYRTACSPRKCPTRCFPLKSR